MATACRHFCFMDDLIKAILLIYLTGAVVALLFIYLINKEEWESGGVKFIPDEYCLQSWGFVGMCLAIFVFSWWNNRGRE